VRKSLTIEELGDLLTRPLLAVLATRYADGTSLLSPVWHEWRDGGFTIVVFDDDAKARHIKRDPRVSVVVADNELPCAGIEVRAEAQIVPTEPDLAPLHRMAARYIGPVRGKAFIDSFDPATQLTLRIVPGVLRTWDFADEASFSPTAAEFQAAPAR
jgi:PPOX class probable F420-dependent enzyme